MDRLVAAKKMRREPSANEAKLWALLRDQQLPDMKFRRQLPIGPYIADFLCLRHRLAVEVDGRLHDEQRDARRDQWFAAQGFRTLRFPTDMVANDKHAVRAAILAAADAPRVDFPPC